MKRILAGALALFSALTFGATLSPIQLLNPAGSSAGQAIVSTGPTTAPLWGGVPLTGVTGTLAVNHGGTGAGSASGTALDNISGFASTGFLTRTGAGTYAFQSTTNGITLGNLAQAAANTVLANGTGSTANVTAFAMPSCSGSANALQWTSGTGFICGSNYALLSSPSFSGTAAFSAITAASTITPSQTAGIVGTTTNNSVNAGSVGEYVPNSATGTSLTTATSANATSESLTAGDWDVSCTSTFVPAGSTVPSVFIAGIGTTSATLPGTNTGGFVQSASTGFPAGAAQVITTPTVRVSLASTTTVYCIVQSTFTTSTMTVNGFIRARRPR
jgi:hypothetical protein